MNIVILGANGPTGQLLTRQALNEGHAVTAVTRHPKAFPFQQDHLQIVKGDVFDAPSVESAVAGQDAVLSLVGLPYSRQPITVYSQAITAILGAMHRSGTRRLICVSSGGTNPRRDLREGLVWSLIVKPIFGKTTYEDMSRMERLVMESDRDWTIVRPGKLISTPSVTPYRVAEDAYRVGQGTPQTSRADLADFLLRQVKDDRYVRKAVAIATSA